MRPFLLALAAPLFTLALASSAQAFDVKAGEQVFKKCKSCHKVGEKAKNGTGPILNGVMGREWGGVESYAKKYSKGNKSSLMGMVKAAEEAGEPAPVWNYETMAAWLAKPKNVIPKTRMAYAGLRKEQQIIDVIAYLATFDADGKTVDPAPVLEAAGYVAAE